MHIIKQRKLDSLQAHISALQCVKHIYNVARSPDEKIMIFMAKNDVLTALLEHYYMFALDIYAK